MDLNENERRIEEMLASDSPPTQALGETTDYRQIALAWARAHELRFDEMVRQLETGGGEAGQSLIDEIRRDPEMELVVREGLKEPLTGNSPNVAEYADAEYVEETAD
jgi:hypothetical protein